ncbi:91c0360d-8014-4578-a457-1b6178a6370c [Sclerotinia trifoliorum]|uniref:Fanconi-associated nuclease n=1 Tax=Sclerotinia trifoliorum TaxID=28548 RepID=A0A8H2VXG0_9HELO|nr:91c0360d-8014-4578-a457-1b6178a6370c [Sclerotinia trifoliorum]
MVLKELKNNNQNVMLNRRTQRKIPQDFKDKLLPPSKRLKTESAEDGDLSSRCPSDEEELPLSPRIGSPVHLRKTEILDSEDEGEDEMDQIGAPRVTELESALPPVDIDKNAIAKYEAMRAEVDNLPDDLKSRLSGRTWERGKSSIYSDAFNLALETVLEDEGHLFDEKEMDVFNQWRDLDYEAQYLYVRLFLRKTSAWHRINRLGYHRDLTDVPTTSKVLQSMRELPESAATVQVNPAELGPPEGTVLQNSFTFADSSEGQIKTLDEALSLLNLDELKGLAKELKVQGKNKADILKALRETSQRQSGLGYVGLKRADSMSTSIPTTPDGAIPEEEDDSLDHVNRDVHFLRKIMAITGPCIRLSLPALNLFERVHLVFYRSTEWTDKSLTTIILARISRRNFPSYIVSRSTNIFSSRSILLEFEASIRTQYRVDSILEYSNRGKAGLDEVMEIFEEVYPRWKVLLAEEQRKEDSIYESGEGAYLRRFSPAWVYTRIVHKGLYVFGRFKNHEKEHAILTELLNQKLFHSAKRGAWYQRKALLEEHYMYTLQPVPGINDTEQQKRHWKRVSLCTCEQGLQDRHCHVIYHYDLQKRIQKLEKNLKIPKREKHDFDHALLTKPLEITIQGIQIKKQYLTPTTLRRRSSAPNGIEERQRSTKTIWIDEYEGNGASECSVEELCLSYYRSQGLKGYHSEGGILRTLFAYLFFDILFLYIPNVFQTQYQTCPLDLHTDAFFAARASEINHRIVEIENGKAPEIIRNVWESEADKRTCVVGLRWEFDVHDLQEIVDAFGGAGLGKLMRVMAEEYRVRGGGVPDLFLWDVGEAKVEQKDELNEKPKPRSNKINPKNTPTKQRKKEVRFVEVKSENDRLSDTQRMWIHVLMGAGIRVELCNVVAREVRVIDTG